MNVLINGNGNGNGKVEQDFFHPNPSPSAELTLPVWAASNSAKLKIIAFFLHQTCTCQKKVLPLPPKTDEKINIESMSAQENERKAMAYIAEQSNRVIDYQWEIQHHRQMHAAYEKNL